MNLSFNKSLIGSYMSKSQQARVLTEDWVDKNIFCPSCGSLKIEKYANNKPVADFHCLKCGEQYELKSKMNSVGVKIVDGAYKTMIERLESSDNPNFFLLTYDPSNYSVTNFAVIPKHYFVPKIIEKRKPLALSARRAGWVGCNILLNSIPKTGKIFYVQNGILQPSKKIISQWQKTIFLRDEKKISEKGWMIDIMKCIESIGKTDFSLEDMYLYEGFLHKLHPENKHCKDKIRQQLQVLRDKGYLQFKSRGQYSLL